MKLSARSFLGALLLAACPIAGLAQATITATLDPALDDEFLPNETITFLVEITSNTSGLYPAAAVIEIEYDKTYIDFVGAVANPGGTDPADDWMGDILFAGPEEPNGALTTRDIPTTGNLTNATNFTPKIMIVEMQIAASYTGTPFDISVRLDSVTGYDPGGAVTALYDTNYDPIVATVDDSSLKGFANTTAIHDWYLLDY